MALNRFLHEVTPTVIPEKDRMTLRSIRYGSGMGPWPFSLEFANGGDKVIFPSFDIRHLIHFQRVKGAPELQIDPRIYGLLKHRRRRLPWLLAAATIPLLLAGQGATWRNLNLWRLETLQNCAVLKVHDGDTLHVLCRQHADQPRKLKIRLHCIDAPELAQAPWGREARDQLRRLIQKGPVTVRVIEKDNYRRFVAEVWKDRANANLEMVKTGKAAVYWRHCNSPTYGLAEWKARSVGAGIWRQRGLHQTPWEYRH